MSSSTKNQVRERFSQHAQGYVTSPIHAEGAELSRLVEMAQPQAGWWVLDVATGGGHTGLKFAPQVARVVAADFAPAMLRTARDFIDGRGQSNIDYVGSDAENLAFATASFDLVTCRIAPHHFPDCFRFVQECARVLKPGGLLLIQDHLLPDDEQAAAYIDAFQRLRDPGHVKAFAGYEWEGMLLDAGLQVMQAEALGHTTRLLPWAERQGCSAYVIERLHILLLQAPEAVAAWLKPHCAGTDDASFEQAYLLILGRKP